MAQNSLTCNETGQTSYGVVGLSVPIQTRPTAVMTARRRRKRVSPSQVSRSKRCRATPYSGKTSALIVQAEGGRKLGTQGCLSREARRSDSISGAGAASDIISPGYNTKISTACWLYGGNLCSLSTPLGSITPRIGLSYDV